jgi:hypothetical protein
MPLLSIETSFPRQGLRSGVSLLFLPALIGVPRRYRYVAVAAFVVFYFGAWGYLIALLTPVWPETWGPLLAPLIGWWAAWTLLDLIPLVWPPKPKPGGDPEFITLNLGGGRPPGA